MSLPGASLDGGTEILLGGFSPAATNAVAPFGGHGIFANVSEGEHTVKLRWFVASGTGSLNTPRLTVMNVPKA